MWRFLYPNMRNGGDAFLISFLFLFVGLLTQTLGVEPDYPQIAEKYPDLESKFMHSGKDGNEKSLNHEDDEDAKRFLRLGKRFMLIGKSLNNEDDNDAKRSLRFGRSVEKRYKYGKIKVKEV